jgi:GT2 family glycosyltransferase
LACRGDFVSFIDDDAVMDENFLAVMQERAACTDGRTILSGDLAERGRRICPSNLSFWGNFGKPPFPRLESVIFNSNLFPRKVFDEIAFDPLIRYGYEDSDFCSSALAKGYRIERVAEACNEHLPSQRNREASFAHRECSRYYTSLKRYFVIQRRLGAGMAYLLLAPVQGIAAATKRGQLGSILRVPVDYTAACGKFVQLLSGRATHRESLAEAHF